ncbi:hypothetical protein KGP93_23420, partial [Burkholderia multivorans]|nr:hypothetical protein [Burkholderia multivorans]
MAGGRRRDHFHESLSLPLSFAFGVFHCAAQANRTPRSTIPAATRVTASAAVHALWSAATLLLGFAGSFVGVIVLRLAVGALEAPAYPIN